MKKAFNYTFTAICAVWVLSLSHVGIEELSKFYSIDNIEKTLLLIASFAAVGYLITFNPKDKEK